MHGLFVYVFPVFFAVVAANFLYQIFKKRGLKAAIFGARITRTVGEVDLGRSGPMSTMLKVHQLEGAEPGNPVVGIEVVNRSVASYQMFPIRLTTDQAGALRELVFQAMSGRP
jgi:hypothetical protein